MSGPLLDRIDLQVLVEPVTLKTLRDPRPGESSAVVRDRVLAARERQAARLAPWGLRTNAEMSSRILREVCRLDGTCERKLVQLVEARRSVSARGVDRIIKLARTVADLDGSGVIRPEDLDEAAGYRASDSLAEIPEARVMRRSRPPVITSVSVPTELGTGAAGDAITVIDDIYSAAPELGAAAPAQLSDTTPL
jgi:MoxR-like ATPase